MSDLVRIFSEQPPFASLQPFAPLQVLRPKTPTQPSVFGTNEVVLYPQPAKPAWSLGPSNVIASTELPAEEPPIAYLQRKLSLSPQDVQRAVSIDPRTMHGNPVLQGTRIPLYQIIEELADGSSLEDLVEGYPGLTLQKIQAGLDFVTLLLRVYDEPVFGRSKRQPEGD